MTDEDKNHLITQNVQIVSNVFFFFSFYLNIFTFFVKLQCKIHTPTTHFKSGHVHPDRVHKLKLTEFAR